MAKKRARRGRPPTPPMKRLSERYMIRVTPELGAWVDIVRKQKASAAGLSVDDIQVQAGVRELMRLGAELATWLDQIRQAMAEAAGVAVETISAEEATRVLAAMKDSFLKSPPSPPAAT